MLERKHYIARLLGNGGGGGVVREVEFVAVGGVEEVKQLLGGFILGEGQEGAVLKQLDALYQGGSRKGWFKLKRGLLAGPEEGQARDNHQDDLDLVVMGAYYGKGARSHLWGSFLLGCIDQPTGKVHPLTKIGTGFS